MSYFKDELLIIMNEWTIQKTDDYIKHLEARITVTKELLKELRVIRRKKARKSFDNGARDGR